MLVAALNPQTEPPALWTLVLGRSWMVYTGTQLHSVMFSSGKHSPPYFKFIGKFSNCILAIFFFLEWKVTFHVAAAQLDSRGFCQQLWWTIKVYTSRNICMTANYYRQLNCIYMYFSVMDIVFTLEKYNINRHDQNQGCSKRLFSFSLQNNWLIIKSTHVSNMHRIWHCTSFGPQQKTCQVQSRWDEQLSTDANYIDSAHAAQSEDFQLLVPSN